MVGPLSGPDNQSILSGGGPLSDYSSSDTGYQPSTRTGAQIATQIRRLFGDQAGAQLDDTDFISWINDAQDQISNVNRAIKARYKSDSIKGVSTYAFPNTNVQQIESIHYDGQLLPNISYAQAEEQGYIGNTTAQGQPIVWWEWAGHFTFWPKPPDSKQIRFRYTVRPTPLVDLSSKLGVPDKYYQAVLIYCMQMAYELNEDWNPAQMKAGQFERQLAEFNEEERIAQNMIYESITILNEYD